MTEQLFIDNDDRNMIEKHWLNISILLTLILIGVLSFNAVPVLSYRGLLLLAGLIFAFVAIIIEMSGVLPRDEQKSNLQWVLSSLIWAIPYSFITYAFVFFDEKGILNELDYIFLITIYVLLYILNVLLSLLTAKPEWGMDW